MSADDDYSQVADKQLDSLEAGPDADLYNAVLDACELIFRLPTQAQARSTAIRTPDGIRFRLPVAGHPPYKVFWSAGASRAFAETTMSGCPDIRVMRVIVLAGHNRDRTADARRPA